MGVLIVLAAAGDIGARIYAQNQLKQRIDANVPEAGATAHISGFPFLGKLLLFGKVDKIKAHVERASQGRFTFDGIDLSVSGVKLNRTVLLRDRKVRLESISSGTVKADMSQADFDRLVGVPVTFGDGVVELTEAGATVTVRVAVVNNQLVLEDHVVPVPIPVPRMSVLPCAANVVIKPGHLVISCTFHEIPTAFVQAVARAA